jgi:non-ribosomal peptide synthetase component F
MPPYVVFFDLPMTTPLVQCHDGLREGDRLVAVTTLSFDIPVLELLLPLTVGAQIVLASREVAMDGRALAQLLAPARPR